MVCMRGRISTTPEHGILAVSLAYISPSDGSAVILPLRGLFIEAPFPFPSPAKIDSQITMRAMTGTLEPLSSRSRLSGVHIFTLLKFA